MDTTIWYTLGTLGMAGGSAYALWGWSIDDGDTDTFYVVLALITGVATLAYAAMALGLGQLPTKGAIFYLPRYVDWLITTPLIVLYLAMIARPARRVYVGLVALEVIVIGSGAAAAFTPRPVHWIAYLIGTAAFVGILYVLLRVLPRQAALQSHRPAAIFTKLRNLTVVLWSIYPLVWLLGPFGFEVLLVETEAIVVTYLDLLAKVGFVVIAVNGRDALSALQRASLTPS
ncbi:MAG: bacteriorhodopsin [Halodesulfurarchaeum sp.]